MRSKIDIINNTHILTHTEQKPPKTCSQERKTPLTTLFQCSHLMTSLFPSAGLMEAVGGPYRLIDFEVGDRGNVFSEILAF